MAIPGLFVALVTSFCTLFWLFWGAKKGDFFGVDPKKLAPLAKAIAIKSVPPSSLNAKKAPDFFGLHPKKGLFPLPSPHLFSSQGRGPDFGELSRAEVRGSSRLKPPQKIPSIFHKLFPENNLQPLFSPIPLELNAVFWHNQANRPQVIRRSTPFVRFEADDLVRHRFPSCPKGIS